MSKPYDATKEFAPFNRQAHSPSQHPRPRKGQTQHDRERGRRPSPNTRIMGDGVVSIQLAVGGVSTFSSSGRKNGNGTFWRTRDGACVSHKVVGSK